MISIGLMSGTSLDGIDVALIDSDGHGVQALGPAATYAYGGTLRERLRAILGGAGPVAEVERDLTLAHATAVQTFLTEHDIAPATVDIVGFHGHTILHDPERRRTWQIGDGALLAARLGVPVVNDFRSDDVAAGGQGAPLVPVFHGALARSLDGPVAVLNIGGVANVTWIDTDRLVAFDTGPGNALIDDWALRHLGRGVDWDGQLAAKGLVDGPAVQRFCAHPYFSKSAPKSLDRDEFAHSASALVAGLSPEDGAATLTAFTVAATKAAQAHFPAPPLRWLVTGGGRRNPVLMAGLADGLGAPVAPVETVGWDGDALEAQAFAFLAVRARLGLPITFPATTGGPVPLTGGRHHYP